jgi:hypothetical protein
MVHKLNLFLPRQAWAAKEIKAKGSGPFSWPHFSYLCANQNSLKPIVEVGLLAVVWQFYDEIIIHRMFGVNKKVITNS